MVSFLATNFVRLLIPPGIVVNGCQGCKCLFTQVKYFDQRFGAVGKLSHTDVNRQKSCKPMSKCLLSY